MPTMVTDHGRHPMPLQLTYVFIAEFLIDLVSAY